MFNEHSHAFDRFFKAATTLGGRIADEGWSRLAGIPELPPLRMYDANSPHACE
jgi:hypothetical protein